MAEFNVRDAAYGAQGDGITNDAAAFRAAVTDANVAGGTILVPAGTYRIAVGDPTTDPLVTTVSSVMQGSTVYANYAVLHLTHSDTRIVCEEGAEIQVYASQIFQASNDQEPTQVTHLIFMGTSTSPVERMGVQGGTWTWEAAAPAALSTTNLSFNSWWMIGGMYSRSVVRDMVCDGFPRGIAELGSLLIDGNRYSFNLYENVEVTNYGGGAGDNWLYPQGGTTIRGGSIKSERTYQSHGIYFGLDRPEIVIDGVTFENIRTASKYPIDYRGTSGTEGKGPMITRCVFDECNVVQNGAAIQGDTPKTYFGGTYVGCTFRNHDFPGAGGIVFMRTRGANVIGCTFEGATLIISTDCIGVNVAPSCQFSGTASLQVTGTAAHSRISGTFTNPSVVPIRVSGSGPGIVVDSVQVSINMGATPLPDAAMWIYPTAGSCDVRGGQITLTGQTGYSNQGIRVLSGAGAVSIRRVQFVSDNTLQGWCTVRVESAATGPVRIIGCTERRGTGVVTLPAVNGPQINGGSTTLLDNVFVCKLNGVGGVVRAERNLFGGVGDYLNAGTVTSTQTPNAGPYRVIRYVLGAPIHILTPVNQPVFAKLRFELVQDASGGKQVTWDPAYDVSWTPNLAANKTNAIEFVYDGTVWTQTKVEIAV